MRLRHDDNVKKRMERCLLEIRWRRIAMAEAAPERPFYLSLQFLPRFAMRETCTNSRRRVLRTALLMAGAGAAAMFNASSVSAQKASKQAMKYQDKPNGDQRCDNCVQFTAPDGCKVVEGTISPQGWCIAWVKK
jgi:hypothetical protein